MKRRTFLLGGLITLVYEWVITACVPSLQSKVASKSSIPSVDIPHTNISSSPPPEVSLPVALLPYDKDKATLSSGAQDITNIADEAHIFSVQLLPTVESVTLSINLNSPKAHELRLYKSSEPNTHLWREEDEPVVMQENSTRAHVVIRRSGEYIIGRPTSLGITPTTWFDDTPSFQVGFHELVASGIGSNEKEEFVEILNRDGLYEFSLARRGTQKVAIIFVHGMYDEHKERFEEFFSWIKKDAPKVLRDFFFEHCMFFSFKFDTRRMIDENALKLLSRATSYGVMPFLLVGFSMGGLLARVAHALSFLQGNTTCLGVVTLATPHHGSPLAIPKWVRSALAKLLFGAQVYTLYLIAINNFFAPIQFKTYSRKIIEALKNTSDAIFPAGFRCLFGDNNDPAIPNLKFVSSFAVGQFPLVLPEELSPLDQYGVVCDKVSTSVSSTIFEYEKKETVFGCRTNFAKLTALLEEKAGVSSKPFLTVYGGYYGDITPDANSLNYIRNFSHNSAQSMVKERSSAFEGSMLRIFNTILFPLIPTTEKGTILPHYFNDGLVPLSSQLNLTDGPSFVSSGATRDKLDYDGEVIQRRFPSCIKTARIFKNRNHAQMLERGDTESLFMQLGEDLQGYVAEYHASTSFDISANDYIELGKTLEAMFTASQTTSFQDSNGKGTFTKNSRVTQTKFSPDSIYPDTVGVGVTVYKNRVKNQNGFSLTQWEDTTTYQLYFGRILAKWYIIGGR